MQPDPNIEYWAENNTTCHLNNPLHKGVLKMSTNVPKKRTPLPQSSKIPPPLLHQWVLESKNKQERIDALVKYVSSYGGMSGASPEVWEKLRG